MPLRFMQIFLPAGSDKRLEELLDSREILGAWRDADTNERQVIHLLVPAEETEPIMDRFEQAYGAAEGFHLVLLPVEAVLPRPQPEKEEEEAADEADQETAEQKKYIGRMGREELYSDIQETLGVDRVFIAMTVLSCIVAAAGLMRDDVAVIIGAMVIAPLLGPNVGMSLATTLGDLDLLRRSFLTNVVGVALTMAVALVTGLVFPVDPTVPAIASRTQLGIDDMALALAAGSAGTFAFTRGLAGAVIGVMVAVALVPPLVTFGMLLGAGYYALAGGSLLLVAANVVCINLAGVVTFLLQGVRPRTWWEGQAAQRASRIAIASWIFLLLLLFIILYIRQFFLGE